MHQPSKSEPVSLEWARLVCAVVLRYLPTHFTPGTTWPKSFLNDLFRRVVIREEPEILVRYAIPSGADDDLEIGCDDLADQFGRDEQVEATPPQGLAQSPKMLGCFVPRFLTHQFAPKAQNLQ